MPPPGVAQARAEIACAVVVDHPVVGKDVPVVGRRNHSRRLRAPDVERRLAVAGHPEAVDVRQVVHVVAVQVVDEHFVHAAEAHLRRREIGRAARAAIEDELVRRPPTIDLVARIVAPPHLHEDAHFRLRQPHRQRDHRAHERHAHFVGLERGERIEQRQPVEVGVALGRFVGRILLHHAVEHRHSGRPRRAQARQRRLGVLPRHPIAQPGRRPLHRVVRPGPARIVPADLAVPAESHDFRLTERGCHRENPCRPQSTHYPLHAHSSRIPIQSVPKDSSPLAPAQRGISLSFGKKIRCRRRGPIPPRRRWPGGAIPSRPAHSICPGCAQSRTPACAR